LENLDGHPDEIQKGGKLPSACDAQHTFWKALLALMWPLILVWRMVLATVRTLDEAAVIAQHIHAHQSTQHLASPSSIGNNSLDWDLLRQQIQLAAAMNREDYDAALKIKAAIAALQSRRTNDLATQLLHMSSKMRKDIKDIRAAQNESNLSSLQRLIQDAIEEQDFARAARLHKQLLELAPPAPPPPRADLEYLEWDTKKRVAQALANEKLMRQDPMNDLTAHLAELLLEEDFRQAAKVHAQLRRLQNDRDMQALMHKVSVLWLCSSRKCMPRHVSTNVVYIHARARHSAHACRGQCYAWCARMRTYAARMHTCHIPLHQANTASAAAPPTPPPPTPPPRMSLDMLLRFVNLVN
jgi:protein-arginine kinase activator protein McsA